MDATLTPTVQG